MDIFIEQMVKKKRGVKEFLIVLASMLGVLAVLFALTFAMMIPGLGFMIFAVCVVLIYLLYFLVTSINLEFEYSFTNGVLDVDKIINARRRKSMLEINIRKMELMGDRKAPEFVRYMKKSGLTKVFAGTHMDAEDLCFLVFLDDDGKEKMLLFNPNEKVKDAIRRYNPKKVVLSQ
ncbi:MAG: hypothetical protein J6A56_04395 [Clostridia bacterium]|nr:hypothetical protein [Clostridia bacterium]